MPGPSLALRPYQQAANEAYIDAVRAGRRRTIIQLPTGTGKTVTGLALARRCKGRTLWIAHRDELLTQPFKALHYIWPEAEGGIVKAERDDVGARNIVFASIQTIQNPSRLARLVEAGGFAFVVVDEAHHAPAASYRRVLESLGCFEPKGPPLLGLTATVERTDQAALDAIFQGLAYQLHLGTAIEQGYLVPVRSVARPLQLDLDSLDYRAGDFASGELDAALLEAGIVNEVASAMEEHARDRKSVVFTIGVAQAHAIADELVKRGFAAEALDGSMAPALRQAKLARLASGETKVLCNCAVLTEGFDEPSLDCVVMARPTASKTLYLQCVGRGLRLHPAKSECLVVDLVGVSKRHTLMQAPVLFGVETLTCQSCGLTKPVTAFGMEREGNRSCICQACSRQAERAGVPYDYAARLRKQVEGLPGVRSRFRWVRAREDVFALPAGGEGGTVVLEPAPGGVVAYVIGRRGLDGREVLTPEPVSIDLAQGVAEDYVRRAGCVAQARRDGGGWRDAPTTEKQAAQLEKAGIPVPETAGEASDLLAAHFAQRDLEPATPKQLASLRRQGLLAEGQTITKREAMRLFANARKGNAA